MMNIKVYKRGGEVVSFNRDKIILAITKAYEQEEVPNYADYIAKEIEEKAIDKGGEISVEEIQDLVESYLMGVDKETAKNFITYRYQRSVARDTTDKAVIELLRGDNDYWNNENSNKNARIVTTQRDYLAGITSTDIAKRFLLPREVVEAHEQGAIHQHDMDYMAQNALGNCCLINLEDMLQNGTVINGVKIDSPHRLSTATTIATQIITAVASSQYGGTTITLTHLAPFVRLSKERYLKKYRDYGLDENDVQKLTELDLKKEVADAVQTFNYQVNSMSTTNGQAPFLSVFMYISEDEKYEQETAMLIEEFLNQRILGMKNEKGVYVTPAFPKLLYVLDENNCSEETPYWYLTKLAAACTAKRMVPDYISAKKMREYKKDKNGNGNVYACMGERKLQLM